MGEKVDKLKRKTLNYVYNKARWAYLKKSICNIGHIVELDDKIICYVDQKKLDSYKGKNPIYKLILNGMNQANDESKNTVENFRLNKPVYYIFESIVFKNALEFSSLWANVVFRNCTFNKNIGILWANDVVFENNKYLDHCPIYFYGNCFLSASQVKKLTFLHDNFSNSSDGHHPTKFGMNIDAELLEIIDSDICCEYPGSVSISADKTVINVSDIKVNELYLDSYSIDFTDSYITADSGVMIDNINCDFLGNIDATIILYNGVDLVSKTEDVSIVDNNVRILKQSRSELVDKLREISTYCQQLNEKELQSIRERLNGKTVSRVLKKK